MQYSKSNIIKAKSFYSAYKDFIKDKNNILNTIKGDVLLHIYNYKVEYLNPR